MSIPDTGISNKAMAHPDTDISNKAMVIHKQVHPDTGI
jgi:hypothetical protein